MHCTCTSHALILQITCVLACWMYFMCKSPALRIETYSLHAFCMHFIFTKLAQVTHAACISQHTTCTPHCGDYRHIVLYEEYSTVQYFYKVHALQLIQLALHMHCTCTSHALGVLYAVASRTHCVLFMCTALPKSFHAVHIYFRHFPTCTSPAPVTHFTFNPTAVHIYYVCILHLLHLTCTAHAYVQCIRSACRIWHKTRNSPIHISNL